MIYYFDDYADRNADELSFLLPAYRLEKFNRLKQKRDRENCLYSFLLLKYALKNEYGIDSFDLFFNENGKPYLKDNKAFFSISHSENAIAVAVDKNEIGIDIQEIKSCNEKIMKRVFFQGEIEYVFSSENADVTFTKLWTLKESAVKKFGKTIAQLNDFTFENFENYFEKYGNLFSVFETNKTILSVCSDKKFDSINKINSEVLL